MTAPVPLPTPLPHGSYAVRVPQHTDAVSDALRSAFVVEALPAEMRRTLAKLERQ